MHSGEHFILCQILTVKFNWKCTTNIFIIIKVVQIQLCAEILFVDPLTIIY